LAGTQCTAVLFGRSLRYATPQRLAVLHSRLSALPIRLLVILLAAFVARGALQLYSFHDPDEPISAALARSVLVDGRWGHAWLLQLGLAIVLIAAVSIVGAGDAAPRWWIIGPVALLLWAQSGMGHAASNRWPGLLGRAVDSTHLLGASIWLGTLGVIGLTAAPVLSEPTDLPAMATLIRGFSVFARIGAALAVSSGVVAAVVYAGSLHAFIASTWGRLLLGKVCALAGVAALGWYNWRVATPALATGEMATPTLRRSIRIELAFGVLMIALTAVLVSTPLPGEG
ncbi:MAG: copper resistance D family protein, partial [Gemmatimonadales bacterium]